MSPHQHLRQLWFRNYYFDIHLNVKSYNSTSVSAAMPLQKTLKICVVNFWDQAFKNDFFDYLINLVTGGRHDYVLDVDSADVVLSSVFGKTPIPGHRSIVYLGENIRPNLGFSRYTLSFDRDTFGGRNCCLPLWYARLAWPGFTYVNQRDDGVNTHGYEPLIPLDSLIRPRELPANQSAKKFCVLIAGNPEGLRVNLYHTLRQYKEVDGFGRMFGRPMFSSKFDILRDYKFCLCPENGFFTGYITEKIFDAWYGGTIPIWYGPDGVVNGLNPGAFLNYADTFCSQSLLRQVVDADVDDSKYQSIYCQPLLSVLPRLEPVIEFIDQAFTSITKA